MSPQLLMFVDPAALSDEAASEMLDFLYEFISAFENHYANQLRRYHERSAPPQPDLFEDLDDDLPPF